jgi:chaperonin cofactor prefoldin
LRVRVSLKDVGQRLDEKIEKIEGDVETGKKSDDQADRRINQPPA